MRLCFWAGARCLLLVLVLLTDKAQQQQLRERHYYIAAVEIDWNYSGNDTQRSGPSYRKVVFREYDKDFRQAKTHPSWLGLLGPTLRAEENETIVVTFRNMATGPHSLHPHGIAYGKQSEGAYYFDNTSQKEKEDDVVQPNSEHIYYWEVTSEISPQKNDPTCLTYSYISHQNVVQDYNSGLIGALLICKPGSLDSSGQQVGIHHEYIFLFGVFDERESKNKPTSYSLDKHVKYTINGYTMGSLPDVSMCSNAPVSLHLLGMSSVPEVFSVHLNGQVLEHMGLKVSSVGLISGSTTTASMKPLHVGRWLMSSFTTKHMEAGMHGYLDVKKCDSFKPPRRTYTYLEKRYMREWTYYIAAEEITWDYAPVVHKHVDEDFKSHYLRQSPTRIGKRYKKAVYTLYKNESFTERSESKQRKNELGILGPVIRAQIRDVITIVFKNKASRPYSIYPHGLSIEKLEEGANYPAGSNQSHGVPPGETRTYVWKVLPEDGPMEGESRRCLTGVYHSAVDTPRDIASGLIGPILICKSRSLNVRNVQLRADKEQHAMFAVFDENKSWYLDQNIRQYCDRSKVNRADPDFYKSNVKHTINGYMFESGPFLGFCYGEVVTWHVSSVGAQDYIQTATFYGHPFELNKRTEDYLSLYPMTGETITVNMENVGFWLLATLNSHETTKGMRLRFKDVDCIQDNDENTAFTEWKPQTPEEIKEKKEIEKKKEQNKPVEVDPFTAMIAKEWGIRSMRNQSKTLSVELLDLSFLDYDDVGVDADMDIVLNNTKDKDKASKPEPNAQNETFKLETIDGLNKTAINILSQSSENTTQSTLDTTKPDNTTINSSNTLNTNASTMTTATNDMESFIIRILAEDITNLTIAMEKIKNLTAALQGNSTSALYAKEIKASLIGDNQPSKMSDGESTSNINVLPTVIVSSSSRRMKRDVENKMVASHANVSADARNHSLPTFIVKQRTQKGHGIKTKRKKKYKLQSGSGRPFSPRGFNPGMTPRGAQPNVPQPFSDEEQLINVPVVIGVPRPDFSDYELYVPGDEPNHLGLDEPDVKEDEYEYVVYKDPYTGHEDINALNLDETAKYHLKTAGTNVKTYYIAAEEVQWDYGGYRQRRQEKSHHQNNRETKFTKVVFRGYMDRSFNTPEIRGEMDEHLGILGPLIKAEVGQRIVVVFKNNANRAFSLHPNGITYNKQMEGLSYEDGSEYRYQDDNEVKPNATYTYIWKVPPEAGPTLEESHNNQTCRTWAYYSGVIPEKDINSGLIGPLLVCRKGSMNNKLPNMREFVLLFMTFDESKSWYYEQNRELIQRKSPRTVFDPNFRENIKFHSINGIIYSLKGLRMYTKQLVAWHLINMGSPQDFQSVHFHGQTFLHKKINSYRQAVHPLLPGSFDTLEMFPSKPGLWQLETEVSFSKQMGMQTLFLVIDDACARPLGLESGSVKDSQITAINTRGYWEPHLARLNNNGNNAWSTEQNHSWIQVDFQRPVVISQVATQGAKQLFYSQYVTKYYISYSTDRQNWIFFKGDSKDFRKLFSGNNEAYEVRKNILYPPVIGRFIRLHPIDWYGEATLRMEFYGCELDGCSLPLGLETGLIEDHKITASSIATSWFSGPWKPSLARLNRQGTINAWQAENNDMNQWLQVELPQVKKITGIITQGARSLGKEMYVISYSLMYSDNGIHWTHYTDDEDIVSKTFHGNMDNNEHVTNYIYPPIFSRFIRIVPRSWMGSITMRIELLGCDFE